MALTPSTMMALGTEAPGFALPDTDGTIVSLDDLFKDHSVVTIWFLCNHCPYVKHVRSELASLAKPYQSLGVAVVAISSNDALAYPDDSPELMALEKQTAGYSFPYVYDETQDVARAYEAACTPDFYVFDASRKLVYRGQLDDSRPGNGIPVTGSSLRASLDAVLEGRAVDPRQRPSLGCNIKWKPGQAPVYHGQAANP